MVAAATLAVACGDSGTAGSPQPTSAAGKRGLALAKDSGCQACHTANGKNSTGPTWKDLAGSKVQLDGGETIVADDAYMARSITDPKREVVAGYGGIMPSNDLDEAQVADLVAYLNELSSREQ